MSQDLNHVIVIGRCTRDMELKYLPSGMAIGNLAIANNYRKKSGDDWKDEVNFFECVLWGKTAEGLQQYLTKGKQVAIEGELRQERWEKDGQSRSTFKIHVANVQLLGGNKQEGSAPAARSGSSYKPVPETAQGAWPDDNATQPAFEDDVPF